MRRASETTSATLCSARQARAAPVSVAWGAMATAPSSAAGMVIGGCPSVSMVSSRPRTRSVAGVSARSIRRSVIGVGYVSEWIDRHLTTASTFQDVDSRFDASFSCNGEVDWSYPDSGVLVRHPDAFDQVQPSRPIRLVQFDH